MGVEVIRPVPTDTGGVLEGRTRLLGVQHCYRELLGRAAPRAIERVFEMEATAILQGQHPAVGRHDSVEVLPCRFDQRDVIDADTEAVVRHTAELQGAPKCGQVDQAGGLLHRLSFPDAAHLRGRHLVPASDGPWRRNPHPPLLVLQSMRRLMLVCHNKSKLS
jgi:hypothetical protein